MFLKYFSKFRAIVVGWNLISNILRYSTFITYEYDRLGKKNDREQNFPFCFSKPDGKHPSKISTLEEFMYSVSIVDYSKLTSYLKIFVHNRNAMRKNTNSNGNVERKATSPRTILDGRSEWARGRTSKDAVAGLAAARFPITRNLFRCQRAHSRSFIITFYTAAAARQSP